MIDSIGGGGGLITVPTLLTIGVPAPLLLGTNKCISTVGSLPALLRYARAGLLPPLHGLATTVIVLTAAALSAYGAFLSQKPAVLERLHLVVPLLLFGVLGFMLKRWFWDEPRRIRQNVQVARREDFDSQLRQPQTLLPLFGIAAYDGLLGPGTGTFFLTLFERAGLSTLSANALTKIFNFCSNLGALIFFAATASIDWRLGPAGACFYLCGNYLGAGFVLKRGQKLIRVVVLVATAALLVKHLYRTFA